MAAAAPRQAVEEPNPFTALWPDIVEAAKHELAFTGRMLAKAKPLRLRDGVLYIGVPGPHEQGALQGREEEMKTSLQRQGAPRPKRLVFEVLPELGSTDGHADDDDDPGSHLKQRMEKEPVVRMLVEKFNAEIAW